MRPKSSGIDPSRSGGILTRNRFDEARENILARIPEAEADVDFDAEARARVHADARAFLGLADSATIDDIHAAFAASLWDFWIFFFPDYRKDRDSEEEIPAGPFQEEFCGKIQQLALSKKRNDELARAYPREHGKSVIASLVAQIWMTANRIRRFPVLFSDTDTQAWNFLEDIRLEVETNERLEAVYPEFCNWAQEPRVNRLMFGNGTLIMAAGSGKSVRGMRKGAQRPDFITLDDIENDEEVENPKRRKKKMTWYHKVVKKLGVAAAVLIVGTILHAESFLANQVKSDKDVYAALVHEPARMDLWADWEDILRNRELGDAEANAHAFYDAHKTEMDAGAEMLWPSRFPLYQLMHERATDLASFLSERQNNPFDPSASWFPEDRLVFLEKDDMPVVDEVRCSVGFWDPSRGTSKGDTSSFVRLDVMKDGRRIVTEAVTDRIPPEEIMAVIISWHKKRAFTAVGVEKVGLSSYDEQLRAMAQAVGLSLPVVPVTPRGEKNLRIKSLRPDIVAQTLAFADSLPLEAKRQIKFYPQHPNDDFPDATEQAMKLADVYVTEVKAAGGTIEPDADAGRIERESVYGPPTLELPRMGQRLGWIHKAWS